VRELEGKLTKPLYRNSHNLRIFKNYGLFLENCKLNILLKKKTKTTDRHMEAEKRFLVLVCFIEGRTEQRR
jgi:hypothetical protein